MFTGIVREVGRVEAVEERGEAVRLVVRAPETAAAAAVGDSIALAGVCLTAVEVDDGAVAFDAVPETLRRSTLGEWKVGTRVNLERALRMGDRLGGHWVQGHVDGVANVLEVRPEGGSVVLSFSLPNELAAFFVEKGSVCIDGVSLTVNRVRGAEFEVNLIPHTLKVTTLARLEPGVEVNMEADLVARYLEGLSRAAAR